MAKSRGLYSQIFKNFLNSLKPRSFWGELIGKDQNGTEYYESKSQQGFKRSSRWFVPVKEDNQQEIPVEWEAWLRHKRKLPPTEEEIQLNLQKMKQTIENAMRLEGKTEKRETPQTFNKSSFPVYEDYKDSYSGPQKK